MATMKRRVVYMSDGEWAAVVTYALASGKTVSNVVRDAVTYALTPQKWATDIPEHFDQTSQSKRDAILRKINKGG